MYNFIIYCHKNYEDAEVALRQAQEMALKHKGELVASTLEKALQNEDITPTLLFFFPNRPQAVAFLDDSKTLSYADSWRMSEMTDITKEKR